MIEERPRVLGVGVEEKCFLVLRLRWWDLIKVVVLHSRVGDEKEE